MSSTLPQDPTSANPPNLSFPEYTSPTPWPSERDLPGFREASESLCKLIIDVAALVARSCDRYGEARVEGYRDGYLERVVRTSRTTKARLLHYFPMETDPSANVQRNDDVDGDGKMDTQHDEDDWCATHVDHGCLTGLTSAMYVDEAETRLVLLAQHAPLPFLFRSSIQPRTLSQASTSATAQIASLKSAYPGIAWPFRRARRSNSSQGVDSEPCPILCEEFRQASN